MRVVLLLFVVLLGPQVMRAQPTRYCEGAHRFMTMDRRMAAEVERDTIDDWRTGQKVAGCRITAAGLTREGVQRAAITFYERLRAQGWVRTPDPRDAPNESSLRYRKDGADCLFNVYRDGTLLTEAEGRVADVRVPGPGEERFGIFAMCMPAMPARRR